jgi:hypothetical protein
VLVMPLAHTRLDVVGRMGGEGLLQLLLALQLALAVA